MSVTGAATITNAAITISGNGLTNGEVFTIVNTGSGVSGSDVVNLTEAGFVGTATIVGNTLEVVISTANACSGAITASCSNAVSIGSISVAPALSIGYIINNGTIIGGVTGLGNSGTIGTLSNTGTISGSKTGITNTGTLNILSNGGTISGASRAIYSSNGTIGTLSNI